MAINYEIYHGTTNTSAASILSNRQFNCMVRKDHWLGNGAYFFIDDYATAAWWAGNAVKREERHEKAGLEVISPAILKGTTEIENAKLLNLDSADGANKLGAYFKEVSESYEIKGISDKNELRCKLMDTYVKMYELDAVVYTFTRNETPSDIAELGLHLHDKQLCIFNQKVIDFDSFKEV